MPRQNKEICITSNRDENYVLIWRVHKEVNQSVPLCVSHTLWKTSGGVNNVYSLPPPPHHHTHTHTQGCRDILQMWLQHSPLLSLPLLLWAPKAEANKDKSQYISWDAETKNCSFLLVKHSLSPSPLFVNVVSLDVCVAALLRYIGVSTEWSHRLAVPATEGT
jgi:hypothetical protein